MPARHKSTIPADPSQWSEKSKRSVSFFFTSKYEDREYKCWSCGKLATFTAEDQKYTYEVRKASIDQRRVLCEGMLENLFAALEGSRIVRVEMGDRQINA